MKDSTKRLLLVVLLVIVCVVIAVRAAMYFRFSEVVVLKEDVVAGTKITPDIYEVKTVRYDPVLLKNVVTDPTQLFNGGQPGADNGKYVFTPLLAGQLIREESLLPTLTDARFGIGATIPEGHVGVAANLPIANAVGGILTVGQRVNLVYALQNNPTTTASGGSIFDEEGNVPLNVDGAVILNNIQVLDVKNDNGTKRLAQNTASERILVVLAIPVNEARQVSLAAGGGGMIYLSLAGGLSGDYNDNRGSIPVPESREGTVPPVEP